MDIKLMIRTQSGTTYRFGRNTEGNRAVQIDSSMAPGPRPGKDVGEAIANVIMAQATAGMYARKLEEFTVLKVSTDTGNLQVGARMALVLEDEKGNRTQRVSTRIVEVQDFR